MLLDLYALHTGGLQLLHSRDSVPAVIAALDHAHAILFLQSENELLDKTVVDDLITTGKARALPDQPVVVHILFLCFEQLAVRRKKPPHFAVLA